MAQLYAHSIRSASSYVFQPDPPTLAIGRVQQSQIGERTMGTVLAHLLRADAGAATETPPGGRAGPATPPRPACAAGDQAGPVQDQSAGQGTTPWSGPKPRTRPVPVPDRAAVRTSTPLHAEIGRARLAASRLAAWGSQVSRRALRN